MVVGIYTGDKMPKSRQTRTKHVPYAKGFRPPSEKTRAAAMTDPGEDRAQIPAVFSEANDFTVVPKCTSIDDWLAQYKECGQTYGQYQRDCPWISSRKWKHAKMNFQPEGYTLQEKYPDGAIYIVQLGDFADTGLGPINVCTPDVDAIVEYTRIFLGLPVKKLPMIKVEASKGTIQWSQENDMGKKGKCTIKNTMKSRYDRKTNRYQLCIDGTLLKLRGYLPNDALCLIALTMCDLYEDHTDLFVAGMAAGNHSVAVFSLARYDPSLSFSKEHWYEIRQNPISKNVTNEREKTTLQRSCKLVVHEISHLLGFAHCIYYACCMNGAGHLDEDFHQPMFLCPVDLRKLHRLTGVDVLVRYHELKQFFEKHNMDSEVKWLERRIERLAKS